MFEQAYLYLRGNQGRTHLIISPKINNDEEIVLFNNKSKNQSMELSSKEQQTVSLIHNVAFIFFSNLVDDALESLQKQNSSNITPSSCLWRLKSESL